MAAANIAAACRNAGANDAGPGSALTRKTRRCSFDRASGGGEPNNSNAQRLKVTNATAGKWRKRFIERRIAGLYDDVRPGKPRTIDDESVAQLIRTTLHTKPADGATHWSVRSVAAETRISKSSVQRYFQLFGLQPHRPEGFKLSNDPFFIEKTARRHRPVSEPTRQRPGHLR